MPATADNPVIDSRNGPLPKASMKVQENNGNMDIEDDDAGNEVPSVKSISNRRVSMKSKS